MKHIDKMAPSPVPLTFQKVLPLSHAKTEIINKKVELFTIVKFHTNLFKLTAFCI